MPEMPQSVINESRQNIDKWAAESRLMLLAEPGTRWTAERLADFIAALGHPGAGRALVDAGYILAQFIDWYGRNTGQEFNSDETAALLGTAGLVLAEREASGG
jgi:hypothetical protein